MPRQLPRRYSHPQHASARLLPTTMFLPAVAPFLLLPYVAAAGVHKLKLKKFNTAPVDINPALESAYLAGKYGTQTPGQMPLLGSGGQGRRLDSRPDREDLYWTQEVSNGGHNVPLTSSFSFFLVNHIFNRLGRLYECAVLYRDLSWNSPSECKFVSSKSRRGFDRGWVI
jgi:hypothetical protein